MSERAKAKLLDEAAEKVADDLLFPRDLAHLRGPLAAWLRDEAVAVAGDPGRYCGAALDMARAILGRGR